MKYVLIVGDGMADYPIPELGNLTPLQKAYTPNMDEIAASGRCGLLKTIPDSCTPGSDVAILSLLGYNPNLFYTGRGAFEAAARGIELKKNDVAFRCNLVTEKDGILVDYSAGHITSAEASELIKSLKTFYENNEIELFPGLDYRHFLIMRNLPKSNLIDCTPPHDAIGAGISTILPKAKSAEVEETAHLLREKILNSKRFLEAHPINIARQEAGKRPANLIWPWGGGNKPALPPFSKKYRMKAAVISAVDLVKGIGVYAGMRIVKVPGATGLHNTNYEGKADFALKSLEDNDFVFIHVEAPDEAGHVKDLNLKVKTIEDFDKKVVGRILNGLKEPCAIAVLPDHATPIQIGTHTRDPVPFAISSPYIKPDAVRKFDEFSAKQGGFGLVENEKFMSLLMSKPTSR